MKKMFAILVSLLCFGASHAQKVKGSDTVLPITQAEAEAYAKKGGNVSVNGGGSGVGIAALLEGSCDIAQSSRQMKFSERKRLEKAGKQIEEMAIAQDAIAIVVNPTNKISRLTREQIEKIYTGKITNWKQVGGEDRRIIVYARESSSGTYEFFKESVLRYKNHTPAALAMPATGAVIQSVSQTKGAIGYVGFAYLNNKVKALEVSYDGKEFFAPTAETAKNKTYPIVRPLIFYYEKQSKAKVKPFIDFILSSEGQKIVENVGYIPIK